MTDIRSALGAQRLEGELRRHRHSWTELELLGNNGLTYITVCRSCRVEKDPVKSKRGRSARSRGNSRELELARELGGTKVGMFGGPVDVQTPLLNVQSKVRRGAAFPSWMMTELAKLPRTGGRVPALIVTDSPGSGIRRHALVVLELSDFVDLHGRLTPEEEA